MIKCQWIERRQIMKRSQRERVVSAVKKFSTMSATEFVRWFPSQWISLINTGLLILTALLPVLVSLIFQEPLKESNLIDIDATNLLNMYAFSAFWYQAILYLGFALGLMAVLVFVRNMENKKFLRCFQWNRIKTSLLPVGLLMMLVWSIPSALLSSNPKLSFLGDG